MEEKSSDLFKSLREALKNEDNERSLTTMAQIFNEFGAFENIPVNPASINKHQKNRTHFDSIAHQIVRNSNSFVTSQMISLGYVKSLEKRDRDWQTLALSAALAGNLPTLQALEAAGADINAKDRDGCGILLCSVFSGESSVVEHVLTLPGIAQTIDSPSVGDEVALVKLGQEPEEKEIESSQRIGGDGWNEPYEYKTFYVKPEIPELGDKERGDYFPNEDLTPLQAAIVTGSDEIFDLLIAKGANPAFLNNRDQNIIHTAIDSSDMTAYRKSIDLLGPEALVDGPPFSTSPFIHCCNHGSDKFFAAVVTDLNQAQIGLPKGLHISALGATFKKSERRAMIDSLIQSQEFSSISAEAPTIKKSVRRI